MSLGKEILLGRARLAEKKQRREEMEMRAGSYIQIIRDIIDPYGGDFTRLDLKRAEVNLKDFIALQQETRALDEEIRKLERDLNG